MTEEEYISLDATALGRAIAAGEASRAEAIEAARARIAKLNPTVNAVIDLYDEPVEDSGSRGIFAGVPFLLKDIGAGIAGKRTTCASRALLNAPPQDWDDELTLRFKRAGLRILGKSNLPEFGFNVTTESQAFGPTRNPFNLEHSPGGSSGGAAAAVASGMVPIAHATDGAGSIRIPAACCGLVGLKPSRGLIPQGPRHADIYGGLVSEGVVSRSIRDTEAALAVMAGEDAGTPYAAPGLASPREHLRIGLFTEAAPDIVIDADARLALDGAADRLRGLGHEVADASFGFSPDEWRIPRDVYRAQVCAQAAADFARQAIPEGLETINRAAILEGRAMPVETYLGIVRRGQDFARRFAGIWERFDILLSPALSGAAPKLGLFPTDHDDVALHVDRMTRLAPFAGLFNLTGGPALVVCVGRTGNGLPIGVQLAGRLGDDRLLLTLGSTLHNAV
jgi:amidase